VNDLLPYLLVPFFLSILGDSVFSNFTIWYPYRRYRSQPHPQHSKMAGGGVLHGTADTSRIEAPVTMKAYLMCAFAAFGGIFFGYDTGWMGG
jgi:hypothetical protein